MISLAFLLHALLGLALGAVLLIGMVLAFVAAVGGAQGGSDAGLSVKFLLGAAGALAGMAALAWSALIALGIGLAAAVFIMVQFRKAQRGD